jgi:uncharacterized protein (DUF58 family)
MSSSTAPPLHRFRSRVSALHQALNYDFCPHLNGYVMWIRHPLACLAAATITALVCGIFVNPYTLILAAVLVGLGGLGVVWPRLAVRGLSCELSFSTRRVRAGEAVLVSITIRNRSPFPVWGLSLHRGFAQRSNAEEGIAVASLASRSMTELAWSFVPGERGVYPLEEPQLETGFPFGLLRASVPVRVATELTVWPRSVSLDTLPDAVELNAREDRLTDRRVGDLGDLVGTRGFRSGDSLRRVHWQQTARFGQLIVTERQAPASCSVHLQVDISHTSHHSCGEVCTLETTLSVAASIVESLHRAHAFVDCRIGDRRFSVGESRADLHRVLDALARVPRHGAECPAVTHPGSFGALKSHTSILIS